MSKLFIYINKWVLSNYKSICTLYLFLAPAPRSISPRPSRVVRSEWTSPHMQNEHHTGKNTIYTL